MIPVRAASRVRRSGAPGTAAPALSSAWHPSGPRVSAGSSFLALHSPDDLRRCSSAASPPVRSRIGRGDLCAQTHQQLHPSCFCLVQKATRAIGCAEDDVRGEDMLLDLRGGFRVLCAHVAAVGGAGCQRDDAAAGRSRSSQPWPSVTHAMTNAATIDAECWMRSRKLTPCLELNNKTTTVLMTRRPS